MQDSPRQILVVHNPTAGWRSGGFCKSVIERLRAAGAAVDLRLTAAPGDAGRIVAEADLSKYAVVAVAGGDGTINEAANALAALPEPGLAPPLGIIPTGTANVLAHEIGLARSVGAVADCLMTGEGCMVQAGRINGRIFLAMASAGFDAWVVDTVDRRVKRVLSKGAYVLQTLIGLAVWRPQMLRVDIDGERIEATTVVVMNGRHYGGPFVMAPEASLFEPVFHVYALRRHSIVSIARCGIDLALGRIAGNPNVFTSTAQTVTIGGGDGPMQADGDMVGHLPARFDAGAAELNLLFPSEPTG